MRVFILSKRRFDNFMDKSNIHDDNVEEQSKSIFISINETILSKNYKPYFNSDHSNVRTYYFDDVEESEVLKYTHKGNHVMTAINAISYEQAKDIVQFVERNKDAKICMVHCAAGVSRSGAVGTFINDIYGIPYEDFRVDNPHILPNARVIAELRRAYNEMIDFKISENE